MSSSNNRHSQHPQQAPSDTSRGEEEKRSWSDQNKLLYSYYTNNLTPLHYDKRNFDEIDRFDNFDALGKRKFAGKRNFDEIDRFDNFNTLAGKRSSSKLTRSTYYPKISADDFERFDNFNNQDKTHQKFAEKRQNFEEIDRYDPFDPLG